MNNGINMMLEPEAVKLIEKYSISYPRNAFVETCQEACQAAAEVGFPVVMKIVSPDIIHKSDAGGVKVNIRSQEEAKEAFEEIMESVTKYNPHADIKGVFICEMADKGEEVIIGTVVDDIFGPTIMFGLGGIFVEVLKDVTFRVCPVDKKEALNMVKEIKGYDILKGARGQAALDVDGLAELISKVSNLAVENEDVREIDLNPVRVYEDRVSVLDARVIR